MKCPKCQYERQKTDSCPVWKCPKCGIAYNKYSPGYLANKEITKKAKAQKKRKNAALAILLPSLFMFYLFVHGLLNDSITLPASRAMVYTLEKAEHPAIFMVFIAVALFTSIGLAVGSLLMYLKAKNNE